MNGVYIVKIDSNNNKPEPTISLEKLLEYKEDIKPYLTNDNEKCNQCGGR